MGGGVGGGVGGAGCGRSLGCAPGGFTPDGCGTSAPVGRSGCPELMTLVDVAPVGVPFGGATVTFGAVA